MSVRILVGDALTRLRELPAESVQCVVTSPPYWGLRDYGNAKWEGGDPECEHEGKRTISGGTNPAVSSKQNSHPGSQGGEIGDCVKCGARKAASGIGLEPTLAEHIDALVAVFREVRRVLRRDGTVWLNYGDAYAGAYKGGGGPGLQRTNKGSIIGGQTIIPNGMKPKDLMGMAWRLAFAFQDDGWWLRSANVWNKPNPMPESVVDRPSSAYEMVFQFAQSGDSLFWTHPALPGTRAKPEPDYWWLNRQTREIVEPYDDSERNPEKWRRVNLWKGHDYFYDADAVRSPLAESTQREIKDGYHGHATKDFGSAMAQDASAVKRRIVENPPSGANLRNVWTIPTQGYRQAHFATFPEALVQPCIASGTSKRGACPECGAPWTRVVEKVSGGIAGQGSWVDHSKDSQVGASRNTLGGQKVWDSYTPPKTTGWEPSCDHAADPIPCTVMDPFAGSGTVGLVAARMNRSAVLIELNPEYAEMAKRRIHGAVGLFSPVSVETKGADPA